MNQKHIIALICALGFAFLTALITHALFERSVQPKVVNVEAEKPKESEDAEVLVTTQNLGVGTPISADLITWQKWPIQGLHSSYLVRNEENQDKYQQLIGGLVKRPINQGEPITMDDIIKKGERSFLAAIVHPGMRAVSLPLGNTGGILISPGDWVDVISANMHTENGKEDTVSGRTLAYNVKVLAVDQYMDDTSRKDLSQPRFITLEVNPEQAEILSMAMKLGNLIFSVRGLQKDKDEIDHPLIDMNDLRRQLKDQSMKNSDSLNKPPSGVTVVRGVKAEKIIFDDDSKEKNNKKTV